MEITIDIGKNAYEKLKRVALLDDVEIDVTLLDILDLGLKAYQFSKEKPPEKEVDPLILTIANKVFSTHLLVQEILTQVFEKDKSLLKAYDAITAIRVTEQMAISFLEGQSTNF
jgi:hypothetical protein